MDGIKISTTQNVDLEYEPAGLGYRLLSSMLDMLFMSVYVLLLMFIVGFYEGLRSAVDHDEYGIAVFFILAMLPVLLYHFLSEQFMNGQSFGKKIVGIRVIRLDGTQPNLGSYAIRSLFRIIDVQTCYGLVAIISIAASEKSQRLGDMASGTTVIRVAQRSRISLRDTILYRNTESNYQIIFQQVALLSDRDVGIIKEVLDFSLANNKPNALRALAEKVKIKMGVTSNMPDATFLKAVLMDYSQYQFEK